MPVWFENDAPNAPMNWHRVASSPAQAATRANLASPLAANAVHNLSHRKTIIMIAHRMSTVRECDILYLLEGGRLVAEGSYDELLSSNQQFQSIVNG